MHSSWLLKLLLVFVFFLPFRSVQVPVGVLGFELNPARIAIALGTLLLLLNLAVDLRTYRVFHDRTSQRNPFVFYLFVYFLFSIAYFYVLVALGKVMYVSGGGELFFRSSLWRPFVQLISFATYGLIPYVLVQYLARQERTRVSIERAFVWALLILVGYAYVQILAYISIGSALTGRQIFEFGRDLGYVKFFGIPFYRVNSLAGEPRDFGSLLVGVIPFYIYSRGEEKRSRGTVAVVLLMFFALFLTSSTSALLTLGLSLVVIVLDSIVRTKIHFRLKHLGYGLALVLASLVTVYTRIVEIIGRRTLMVTQSLVDQIRTGSPQPIAQNQTFNLIIFYYVLHLYEVAPLFILFGSGYSNFITPLVGLLQRYFSYTVEDTGILTSDSFAINLFIEGGIVGIAIYLMMFFYTLKLNGSLLHIFRQRKDQMAYRKALWLRFAFIAFFVSGAIQISSYYFIIMGLVVGWLNGEIQKQTAYERDPSPVGSAG